MFGQLSVGVRISCESSGSVIRRRMTRSLNAVGEKWSCTLETAYFRRLSRYVERDFVSRLRM